MNNNQLIASLIHIDGVSEEEILSLLVPPKDLARLGYDQIPAGSNWWSDTNYAGTVDYCTRELPQEKLLGFMTAPWYATFPEAETILLEACDQVAAAHRK